MNDSTPENPAELPGLNAADTVPAAKKPAAKRAPRKKAAPGAVEAAGLEAAPFATARWVKGPADALADFAEFNRANLAKDRDGDPVFLAKSAWDVSYQQERNPQLVFSATKER